MFGDYRVAFIIIQTSSQKDIGYRLKNLNWSSKLHRKKLSFLELEDISNIDLSPKK